MNRTRNIQESTAELALLVDVDIWRQTSNTQNRMDLIDQIVRTAIDMENYVRDNNLMWDGEWFDVCEKVAICIENNTTPNWHVLLEDVAETDPPYDRDLTIRKFLVQIAVPADEHLTPDMIRDFIKDELDNPFSQVMIVEEIKEKI